MRSSIVNSSPSERLRSASSISYASSKLGVSRPTLYRYMRLYEEGRREEVPERVAEFLDYCRSKEGLSEEDVVLYLGGSGGEARWGPSGRGACLSDGGKAMIVLKDPGKDRSVEVAAVISGETIVLGEYPLPEGRGFVMIDDLVPGHEFLFRAVSSDRSDRSGWERFTVRRACPGRRGPGSPRRRTWPGGGQGRIRRTSRCEASLHASGPRRSPRPRTTISRL